MVTALLAHSVFFRRSRPLLLYSVALALLASSLFAQDDRTTQNGSSAMDGAWITGPASNPLSFLNGPAYRTFGSTQPYDLPDFHPLTSLNARMPTWLTLQAEERMRADQESAGGPDAASRDRYLLNRFRFQADLRAGSWLRLSAQVQDARPFFAKQPSGPPDENRWDLKLAYAELGDPSRHWFSLRVGRQTMNYNNTLIASSEWRNQGRSYDAAVLNLAGHGAALGLFAATIVVPQDAGFSRPAPGNNIYGAYAQFHRLIARASIEPFVLWRVQPHVALAPALSAATGHQDMKAWGLRWKGIAPHDLDYSAEAVAETGSDGSVPVRAWAGDAGAAYQLNQLRGRPRLFVQYDFASGAGSSSATHRTFDTIYPTAHDRFGILDLFSWQNLAALRAGTTFLPRRRWSITAQALDMRAVSLYDTAYNSSGTAIARNPAAHGRHMGQEFDAYSWYELNRNFNVGAGFGWFGNGDFLALPGAAHGYSSSYLVLNFKDHGRQLRE
jgi:Alginate export